MGSRTESRRQPFGTTGRGNVCRRRTEKCPLATTRTPSSAAPALRSIQILRSLKEKQQGRKPPFHPALGVRGRWGTRQGAPGESAPPLRRQSALQTNPGPSAEPALVQDPGTRLATKRPVLQPTRVNANPQATYLSLQREQRPRTVHDFVSVQGSLVATLRLPECVQDQASSLPVLLQGLPSEERGALGAPPPPIPPPIQQPGVEVVPGSSPLACQFGAKLLASHSTPQLGSEGSRWR